MDTNEVNASTETKPKLTPLTKGLLGAGIVFVAMPAVVLAYQLLTWPNVQELARRNPTSTAFIERYLERSEDSSSLSWMWTDWENISPNVKAAVLVSEDIEFFTHDGFSRSEIRAAIKDALQNGDLRGASTLTQQLAKNLWLTPSRNPMRKVKEAVLTLQIEKYLTKKRIFEIYLNVAEFGPGIYGIEAASRTYFAKTANRLSRREGALLAASLPRPSRWNPTNLSSAYVARAGRIEDLISQHRDFLERRVGLAGGSESSTTAPTLMSSAEIESQQANVDQGRP